MGALALETGRLAVVQESRTVTGLDFGARYGAFRSVDRFGAQLADTPVGLITWPGGTMAEQEAGRYGFQFDGLFDPAINRPDLGDMFAIARAEGAGLSVVLPTARYEGCDAGLRADIRAFMGKVVSGHYGPLPEHLQFEIGNEWYCAFGATDADAQAYGHIADIYVDEIAGALNDPSVNVVGADIAIAVQGGRTLAEDAALRSEFHDDHLAEVDLVTHHRFAFTAAGVDKHVHEVGRILDAWEADAHALGGGRPALFLGAYNVASLTRDEALEGYVRAEAALGHVVARGDIDMQGRGDDGFESYWQAALGRRDYGAEHPRLMLEAFAEYGGLGMGAAATYGVDMDHPGRLTTQDARGQAQDFVGQDMLDMLGEATLGTRLLKIGLTNDRADDVWVYGFENADKLVVFLSADDTPPGQMTVSVKGLGTTYRAVYGDSLTSRVPADWMERFGIVDTPSVDETNEGRGYAIGIRQAVTPQVGAGGVTVRMDHPHEVIRLSFAKTDAGLHEIAGFSDDQGVELAGPHAMRTDAGNARGGLGGDLGVDLGPDLAASIGADTGADSGDETGPLRHAAPSEGRTAQGQADEDAVPDDPPDDSEADAGAGFDLAVGGVLAALLPLLMLL